MHAISGLVPLAPAFLSLVVTAALAAVTWTRRRAAPGASAYAVTMLAEAVWSACFVAEQLAPDLRAKIFWDNLQYPPLLVAGASILALAWSYTGRPAGLRLVLGLYVAVAAPGCAWILTEPWHRALREGARLVAAGPFETLTYPFTPLDQLLILAVFVANLVAATALVAAFRHHQRPHRTQAGLLAAGIAGPTLLGYASIIAGVTWLGQRDVTPLLFGPFSLVTAWALFGERVFDLVPVARDAVLEGLAEAVLVLDARDRVVDANPRARALLGLEGSDVGRPVAERARGFAEIDRAARAGGGPGATAVLGDLVLDVRSSPIGERGLAGGRVLVLNDVTALHRANEALRAARDELEARVIERTGEIVQRERTLAAIFDHSLQLMGLVGPGGEVLRANVAALALAGLHEDDVLGRPFWETRWWTHDPEQQARLREALGRAARGEVVRMLVTHLGPGGDLREVDFSLTPVPDGRGGVARIVCEGRDVTEVRRMDRERQVLEERLRRTDRLDSLGRLAGTVAHDFNNLVAAISINATLAREEVPEASPAAEALDEIRNATRSATALTRRLFAFGRQELAAPTTLALGDALEGIRPLLARVLGRGVSLEIACSPDVGAIRMDPAQLEQVLVNLAVNARDAMPAGGTFTVAIERHDYGPGEARNWGIAAGRWVRITVSDTGVGMAAEVQARAFEPFFTTKGEGHGTGLGLASVYGIVRTHGGAIELQSEPGRGTRFAIHLPRV